MKPETFKLSHPPIVEAIIDIDCDLPPNLDFNQIERTARDVLQNAYPKVRRKRLQGHSITPKDEQTLSIGIHHGLQAIQFCSEDEKQLTQFRPAGYSFNRLSPYAGPAMSKQSNAERVEWRRERDCCAISSHYVPSVKP